MDPSQPRRGAQDRRQGARQQPVDAFKEWVVQQGATNYYDPDAMSDTELLQKNIDDLVKLGVLPAGIDVAKHTDMSMIEEARKRLK